MKINKQYLLETGWKQDDDLYWHKNGHIFNWVDDILWMKDKKSLFNIESVELLERILKEYKIENRSKKLEKLYG